MALEKALVQPLDEKGHHQGEPVKVLFNPAEYSIEKSNQFQSTAIPGLQAPVTSFVSGNAATLSMDLFFDTYEQGTDVRNYSGRLTAMLDIDRGLHAPPVCKFIWGKLEFKGVLERVSQRFTMFLDSGIPVRATLSVTFKEYKTITEQLQSPPRQSADRTKHRVVKQGDSLWLLADREYGDPGLWRIIARANNIDNPRLLQAGREILIPPLE
ncbi:MAG: LysM peptidoglycan-binding domain-containing protein [Desulfotomaculaceae bacterium]|nr:LysM peptidoglycan-binding domain-containing protein [Desulfotomaculaceae bacterium]